MLDWFTSKIVAAAEVTLFVSQMGIVKRVCVLFLSQISKNINEIGTGWKTNKIKVVFVNILELDYKIRSVVN